MQKKTKLEVTSGFITPENIQIEVPITEMGEFCKRYCLEYASKNEANSKKFNDFAKNYTYLKPYLEFLISELGFIQVGLPTSPKRVCCSLSKNNTVIYDIDILNVDNPSNIYDSILKTIGHDCYHQDPSYSCCDKSLDVKYDINCLNSSGYIMNDGVFIDRGVSHEIIGTSVLCSILLECRDLLIDFTSKKNKFHNVGFEHYLVQKLGVIKFDYYKSVSLYYVDDLMSMKQKEFIYKFIDRKISFNELKGVYDREETKALIGKYNNR